MRKETTPSHQKTKHRPLPSTPRRKAKSRRAMSSRESHHPHVGKVERTPDGTIEDNVEEAAP